MQSFLSFFEKKREGSSLKCKHYKDTKIAMFEEW